jgi:hypothetical protein
MTPPNDVRIIGDVMLATLLTSGLRLVMVKAFIEPAAVWLGRHGWKRLDAATGDRLPDLFP